MRAGEEEEVVRARGARIIYDPFARAVSGWEDIGHP